MVDGKELKGDVWYAFKGEEKASRETGRGLRGGGEALRMTEGMEGNGEAPNMRKIATVRL